MASVKIIFSDEVNAIQLLTSLPESWETMKTTVSNSLGDKSLKFSEICDAAIAQEIRRKGSGKESTSVQGSALAVEKGKEKVASDDR